jgi:hypothetical protein
MITQSDFLMTSTRQQFDRPACPFWMAGVNSYH